MFSPNSFIRAFTLLVAALLLTGSTVDAQHLRYKTKSKMKIEALGFLAGLFDSDVEEEVSMTPETKRVDQDDNSTITRLNKRDIVYVNHDDKEYSIVTFEEMMEMFEDATRYGKEKAEEAQAEMESDEDRPEYNVDFDLRVEETGKEKKIDGHNATQKVLIIETIFEPEDEAAEDSLPATSLYVINDMWLSDDVPEMAVNEEFNRKMAEIMQSEITEADMSALISMLLESDPRVGEAMEKAQEEAKKLGGMTLMSTMRLVTVPPDKELDLALALGEKEKEGGGGGLGGFLKKAAKMQGMNVGDDDEDKRMAEQTTLLTMETKTEDISDKPRDADYYEIPEGYKKVEYERPMLPGQKE